MLSQTIVRSVVSTSVAMLVTTAVFFVTLAAIACMWLIGAVWLVALLGERKSDLVHGAGVMRPPPV